MSMRKLLFFTPLLVALGLGFFLWRGLALNPQELPSALIGEPVPAFELQSLENPDQLLTQTIFKGRVNLLNVWATWCTACREEHPFLMELAENRGIPIIGLDYKDDREAALKWQSDLGNPYRITLFDNEGHLGLNLGVYGVPETFLIDKEGIIRLRHAGIVNEQVWQDKFLPLFEQYQRQ